MIYLFTIIIILVIIPIYPLFLLLEQMLKMFSSCTQACLSAFSNNDVHSIHQSVLLSDVSSCCSRTSLYVTSITYTFLFIQAHKKKVYALSQGTVLVKPQDLLSLFIDLDSVHSTTDEQESVKCTGAPSNWYHMCWHILTEHRPAIVQCFLKEMEVMCPTYYSVCQHVWTKFSCHQLFKPRRWH